MGTKTLEFSENELKALVNEIAILCEKQYRQGILQRDKMEFSKEQIAEFEKPIYTWDQPAFMSMLELDCEGISDLENPKSLRSIIQRLYPDDYALNIELYDLESDD